MTVFPIGARVTYSDQDPDTPRCWGTVSTPTVAVVAARELAAVKRRTNRRERREHQLDAEQTRRGGDDMTTAKIPSQRNRPALLPYWGSLGLLLTNASWPLDVFVPGRPAPQGSKRALGPGRMIEMSKYVDAWRTDVRAACLAVWQNQAPLDGPLLLEIEFVRARPVSAPKRSTPSATSAPDLSKLLRSTEDAITSAGVWVDDSRVVCTLTTKRIAGIDETPGARIRIGVPG